MALSFNTVFEPKHGVAVKVDCGVTRITAPNSGPYTFKGTNTYLVGKESIALVDPGPENDSHFAALMTAIGERTVDAIVLTHSHLDHTPLTAKLKKHTGATVYAAGPHKAYRELTDEETEILGRSADLDFFPDQVLSDGEIIKGNDWQLETVLTPGHTANHAAFAIVGTDNLLSGDHVMGWSTTVVAPPDGSMVDYLRSLDVLLARRETRYLPGHGDVILKSHAYVKGLKTHRILRETAILEQITRGVGSVSELVRILYRTVPKKLHAAAGMTVLAHLEALIESGKVSSDDNPITLASFFEVSRR